MGIKSLVACRPMLHPFLSRSLRCFLAQHPLHNVRCPLNKSAKSRSDAERIPTVGITCSLETRTVDAAILAENSAQGEVLLAALRMALY